MPLSHAVVWVGHESAQVLQFDAEHVQAQKVKSHGHYARQQGSAARSEQELFGEVCDALGGIKEVLITGSHQAQLDFKRYAEQHRPSVLRQIVGYESVDRPAEKPLIAMARKYFVKFDGMAGSGPAW